MARKRIPFIACEFEVFESVQAIALGAKQDEAKVGWGLMRLWRRCWEAKTDLLHEGMIEGYVPGCLEQLILFGFAERWDARQVRIKGLDRYLRVTKSQRPEKYEMGPLESLSGTKRAESVPESQKSDESAGKIEHRSKDLSLDLGLDEPPKGRKLSKWEELWADMTEERLNRLEVLKKTNHLIDVRPEKFSPQEINALLSELAVNVEQVAGESFSSAETEIAGAWRHYLIDPWGAKLSPEPYPLRAFLSFKVWPRNWHAYNEQAIGGEG